MNTPAQKAAQPNITHFSAGSSANRRMAPHPDARGSKSMAGCIALHWTMSVMATKIIAIGAAVQRQNYVRTIPVTHSAGSGALLYASVRPVVRNPAMASGRAGIDWSTARPKWHWNYVPSWGIVSLNGGRHPVGDDACKTVESTAMS